jgi:hypothetical protein
MDTFTLVLLKLGKGLLKDPLAIGAFATLFVFLVAGLEYIVAGPGRARQARKRELARLAEKDEFEAGLLVRSIRARASIYEAGGSAARTEINTQEAMQDLLFARRQLEDIAAGKDSATLLPPPVSPRRQAAEKEGYRRVMDGD